MRNLLIVLSILFGVAACASPDMGERATSLDTSIYVGS